MVASSAGHDSDDVRIDAAPGAVVRSNVTAGARTDIQLSGSLQIRVVTADGVTTIENVQPGASLFDRPSSADGVVIDRNQVGLLAPTTSAASTGIEVFAGARETAVTGNVVGLDDSPAPRPVERGVWVGPGGGAVAIGPANVIANASVAGVRSDRRTSAIAHRCSCCCPRRRLGSTAGVADGCVAGDGCGGGAGPAGRRRLPGRRRRTGAPRQTGRGLALSKLPRRRSAPLEAS